MSDGEGAPIPAWHLEFQYAYEDLKEARQAHADRTKKRSKPTRRFSLLGWVLFLGLAVMLFFVLKGNVHSKQRAPRPPMSAWELYEQFKVLVWLGGFGVLWAAVYVWAKWALRRQFEREPTWHAAQRLDVTPEGVTHASATARTQYSWDAFRAFGESANLFLMYTGEAFFVVVPKRAFRDQADADAFREFCKRLISPPQRAFPVLPPKG
jgi:hypothetical protein